MFYVNLRIKKDPLTLFSLAKGTMITLGELKLGEILVISATGSRIFGKTFSSLDWNISEALAILFGIKIDEVSKNETIFPSTVSPPKLMCWQR